MTSREVADRLRGSGAEQLLARRGHDHRLGGLLGRAGFVETGELDHEEIVMVREI